MDQKDFQTLFDLAADAIFILDMDGCIKEINPIAHDRVGYTKAEMLGKHIASFIFPEFAAKLDSRFTTVQKEGFLIYESAQVRKDGTVLPVEVCTREVELVGQKVIFSIVREITERKETETQLRQSEETLRAIFDGTLDGICVVDEKTLRYVTSNLAFSNMIGYSPEELTHLDATDFHPEEDLPYVSEQFSRSFRGEIQLATDLPVKRKDGSVFYADIKISRVNLAGVDHILGNFHDITRRKQAEADLRIAATAFESQESLMITDPDGVILRVNSAFTENTGYTTEEIIGQTPRLFKSGRHDAEFYRAMWETLLRSGTWQGEIWDRRKNGEIYPKWLSISAVKGHDGVVTHYVGSHIDITERKASEEKIQHLAFYDPLSGLPNRRLLMDRLKQALVSSARNGREGALLFIDLDHFKNLNDTLGHDIGDLLLQQVARRLESCIREGDTVARLGGDEFLLMLLDLSEQPIEAAAQAEAIGEKILTAIGQPYQLDKNTYRCSASVGVTLFSGKQDQMDELMKQADIAMYQAKKAGRNALRFFDQKMQENISARVSLEGELQNALEFKQFHLYYQIQVDDSEHPLGAEALIRWKHPVRGLVSPDQFIPLAEESGLILPIGLWVLETACAQLKSWEQDERTRDLTLAVNVSARQLHQADFVAQVGAAIQSHAINPKLLKLELTESLLLENVEDTIATMNALNDTGVKFSLDDFGTGFSSLQYLKRLPLDQVKIDKSFVSDIAEDSSNVTIVRTVVAMARSLNLSVIAEGVEREEQRQLLVINGCNHYQGYLFGRPGPIEQFEALLKRN